MASQAATPPALLEATRNSTTAWQEDLQALFEQAKDRFPDVVWELSDDDDMRGDQVEEVWGHKGLSPSSSLLSALLSSPQPPLSSTQPPSLCRFDMKHAPPLPHDTVVLPLHFPPRPWPSDRSE